MLDARRAFSPSMRQNLDISQLYQDALHAVRELRCDGLPPAALPADCPFRDEALLSERPDLDGLLAQLATGGE